MKETTLKMDKAEIASTECSHSVNYLHNSLCHILHAHTGSDKEQSLALVCEMGS